jgi:hypothetical protein
MGGYDDGQPGIGCRHVVYLASRYTWTGRESRPEEAARKETPAWKKTCPGASPRWHSASPGASVDLLGVGCSAAVLSKGLRPFTPSYLHPPQFTLATVIDTGTGAEDFATNLYSQGQEFVYVSILQRCEST